MATSHPSPSTELPRIVIIGAGFGGLSAAKDLGQVKGRITVIDRRNHHLFQPLLYQVATAGLSPSDIAMPIRSILRKQANTEVILGEVKGIEKASRRVLMADGSSVPYDQLVIATGARHSYFAHPEWESLAPGLKTLTDATNIRRRVLLAFERAEIENDPRKRQALLTFILVGAGPTGAEMAGTIAELARKALSHDFRHINPSSARVVLIEAGPRILATFPEALSQRAHRALERLGVEIFTSSRVEDIREDGVNRGGAFIEARTIIWTAGVAASSAGAWLGSPTDRSGRVKVQKDLSVEGHPHVFVIGDTAYVEDNEGHPLPGVAPVAMQQGHYVASVIKKRLRGDPSPLPPFQYVNKGNLATIGRSFAIADFGKVRLSGFFAWILWMVVHIFYLIGFKNRAFVMFQWAWAYLTFQRGARLISELE